MKAHWGSRGITLRILDLGTRWRWVVSFTPRSLYPQGKSLWYPLDRSLGGPQSRSGRGGEEKNSQPPPGIEPQNFERPTRSPALYHTDWAIQALLVAAMPAEMRACAIGAISTELWRLRSPGLFQVIVVWSHHHRTLHSCQAARQHFAKET
jgi:hypothetical protein